jgi:hypothetical protein
MGKKERERGWGKQEEEDEKNEEDINKNVSEGYKEENRE